jgi:translocation and assembly module TamB
VAQLGVWGAWIPPGWRLTGELATSAVIGGRFGAPEYTGTLRGSGIGVRNLLQGVNVTQGEVDVRLEGPTARIERFSARAGEGSVDLTGGASFGAQPSARLALRAERFRVLGRVDRQLVISGRSALRLGDGGRDVQLEGSFGVDEGFFDFSRGDAPSLDDDVNVRRTGDAPEAPAAPAAAGPRRNVQMTLDLNLGERLRLRGRGLETALRGQLRLSSPGNRLAVHGTVSTEGGTYAAYGQKLEIERGNVVFSGPPDSPRLDILALRPNLDVRVGVSIAGSLLMPRVRLYADPDMGETDKLSWLVLGREPDGLGRNDTALLQRAATALLAGEGEAPTDALMRAIGLDDLSFRQSEGEVRETVIALGKQLSRRWYVGYERGVNAATGTFQLVYRIAQRFTLRAQAGEDNAVDLIWIWRRDETAILPGAPARGRGP